ncbi:hypothetical protein ACE02U_06405 [Shewanella xiamenensis]
MAALEYIHIIEGHARNSIRLNKLRLNLLYIEDKYYDNSAALFTTSHRNYAVKE